MSECNRWRRLNRDSSQIVGSIRKRLETLPKLVSQNVWSSILMSMFLMWFTPMTAKWCSTAHACRCRTGQNKSEISLSSYTSANCEYQQIATTLPVTCDISDLFADDGLVIVDVDVTQTTGWSQMSSVQRVMPQTKVEIDVEARRAMTFKLNRRNDDQCTLNVFACKLLTVGFSTHACDRADRSCDVVEHQRTSHAAIHDRFCVEHHRRPLHQMRRRDLRD